MHIPKQYFHNKTVLALIALNAALTVIALVNVMIGVSNDTSPSRTIIFRSSQSFQAAGAPSYLYNFAIFALIITTISTILSIKLYSHRKHLAVSVLGLNTVSLAMTLVVFNALMRTA